jgi:hypothetical protein
VSIKFAFALQQINFDRLNNINFENIITAGMINANNLS